MTGETKSDWKKQPTNGESGINLRILESQNCQHVCGKA